MVYKLEWARWYLMMNYAEAAAPLSKWLTCACTHIQYIHLHLFTQPLEKNKPARNTFANHCEQLWHTHTNTYSNAVHKLACSTLSYLRCSRDRLPCSDMPLESLFPSSITLAFLKGFHVRTLQFILCLHPRQCTPSGRNYESVYT